MASWDYDGSIDRWPVKPEQLWECQRGRVMAHDLCAGTPNHMLAADCIFVDPPYNLAALNAFRTKAGIKEKSESFEWFFKALFRTIDTIKPRTCFIEIGRQYLPATEIALRERFPYVEHWRGTYYHTPTNVCWIVRGGNERATLDLEGVDEADAVAEICRQEAFETIADPCMGRGLVGINAYKAQRRFVGTELNASRLAVMINAIHKLGGDWHVDGTRYEPQPGVKRPVGADRKNSRQQL